MHPEETSAVARNAEALALMSVLGPPPGLVLPHLQYGPWTPVDASGAGLVITVLGASWVKHERLVIARAFVNYPATASGAQAQLGGLPFPTDADQAARQAFTSFFNGGGATPFVVPDLSAATLKLFAPAGGANYTNLQMSNAAISFLAIYTTNP